MMRPSSFAVFALKFLQKSMMFTPCGPSAVPTGGAGVALPAAIWSFTIAWTFFAICDRPEPRRHEPIRGLDLLHLQEIQLHGSGPAKDRDHHLQRVLVDVHLVDHAVEAGERPLVDADLFALLE